MEACSTQKFEDAMNVFVGCFDGNAKMKAPVGQKVEKLLGNPKFQEKMREHKEKMSANKCEMDDIEKFGLFFTATLSAKLGKCKEMEQMMKEFE